VDLLVEYFSRKSFPKVSIFSCETSFYQHRDIGQDDSKFNAINVKFTVTLNRVKLNLGGYHPSNVTHGVNIQFKVKHKLLAQLPHKNIHQHFFAY
jgi:hypothetical protein